VERWKGRRIDERTEERTDGTRIDGGAGGWKDKTNGYALCM